MEIKEYILGDTKVDYLINENNNIGLQIYPKSQAKNRTEPWKTEKQPFSARARYQPSWNTDSLAYFHLIGQDLQFPGHTMKNQEMLKYISQNYYIKGNKTVIETLLSSDNNCKCKHKLTYFAEYSGFEIETEFINESGEDVVLDMLSSFSLDNLSPFQQTDAPNSYNFHRFFGGWSMEGKRICQSIEELSLEKSWAGFNCNNEKFGCKGSYPVKRYFPTAAFEDKKAGVIWAVQLAHNSS